MIHSQLPTCLRKCWEQETYFHTWWSCEHIHLSADTVVSATQYWKCWTEVSMHKNTSWDQIQQVKKKKIYPCLHLHEYFEASGILFFHVSCGGCVSKLDYVPISVILIMWMISVFHIRNNNRMYRCLFEIVIELLRFYVISRYKSVFLLWTQLW